METSYIVVHVEVNTLDCHAINWIDLVILMIELIAKLVAMNFSFKHLVIQTLHIMSSLVHIDNKGGIVVHFKVETCARCIFPIHIVRVLHVILKIGMEV